MSAFPYTRRNGATTYVDAPSNSINSNGSSYFRAVIADSSTPTANIELLSTIFPESMNTTGVSVVGSSTIGPNGDEINSFYFYKARFYLYCLCFYLYILSRRRLSRMQKIVEDILLKKKLDKRKRKLINFIIFMHAYAMPEYANYTYI